MRKGNLGISENLKNKKEEEEEKEAKAENEQKKIILG